MEPPLRPTGVTQLSRGGGTSGRLDWPQLSLEGRLDRPFHPLCTKLCFVIVNRQPFSEATWRDTA